MIPEPPLLTSPTRSQAAAHNQVNLSDADAEG